MQDLLPGPEPERIVLCLSAAEDLRAENICAQHDATNQEEDIERRSQRRISQHASLSEKYGQITSQAAQVLSAQQPAEGATNDRATDRAADRTSNRLAEI